MSEGVVAAIARAYRDPRGAMARRLSGGPDEGRALFDLFLACGLGFVASLPAALRAAQRLDIPDAQTGAIAAHLFGYLFVAPLLAYGLAALVHLAARAAGGRGGFAEARAAVFWSLLLAAPLALALALAGVAVEAADDPRLLRLLDVLGYAGAAFWLWLFAASLAEAEGFAATGRVAAVLAALALGAAFGLGALANAVPAAG
jgi:hypothetical protein